MNSKRIIITFILLFGGYCLASQDSSKKVKPSDREILYKKARKEFHRKNYVSSVKLLEKYVYESKKIVTKKEKNRIFWSIDLVVRTHLRVNKRPDLAIRFLKKVEKIVNLSDAEEDIILEWISVSKEWMKLGKLPKDVTSKEELYKLGRKYYLRAVKKLEYPSDEKAKTDFYIAATYLVPYAYNYNNSERIGSVLLMLGNIRFRSWNDYDFWTENFYLKEVIRRFPHSKLAREAYRSLEEGIKLGYTGSRGEIVPPSQVRMLKVYKKLSEKKIISKPLVY